MELNLCIQSQELFARLLIFRRGEFLFVGKLSYVNMC